NTCITSDAVSTRLMSPPIKVSSKQFNNIARTKAILLIILKDLLATAHLLIGALWAPLFIPSPPMGERVRVRGNLISFPLPLILLIRPKERHHLKTVNIHQAQVGELQFRDHR